VLWSFCDKYAQRSWLTLPSSPCTTTTWHASENGRASGAGLDGECSEVGSEGFRDKVIEVAEVGGHWIRTDE
jgi:hypothetical protein